MNARFELIGQRVRAALPRAPGRGDDAGLTRTLRRWVALGRAGISAAFAGAASAGMIPESAIAARAISAGEPRAGLGMASMASGGAGSSGLASWVRVGTQASPMASEEARAELTARNSISQPGMANASPASIVGASVGAVTAALAMRLPSVSAALERYVRTARGVSARVRGAASEAGISVHAVAPKTHAAEVQKAAQMRQQAAGAAQISGSREVVPNTRPTERMLADRLSRFAMLPPAGSSGFDTRMGPDWHAVGSFG